VKRKRVEPWSVLTIRLLSRGSRWLMRLVYFGSGAFDCPRYALAQDHDIALAVTQPDRPLGAVKTVMPTPVGGLHKLKAFTQSSRTGE